MNILIIGEYSSFAKHLKNGFKSLGHNVSIVTRPDDFKKIKGDKDDILYGYNLSILGTPIKGSARILSLFRALEIRWRLWKNYHTNNPQLIFVINSNFLTLNLFHQGVPISFIKKQLRCGTKMIMSECGVSPADYYNRMDYWKQEGHKIKLEDKKYSFLLKNSHAIIPTCYTYFENITRYMQTFHYDVKKVCKPIPLPITIDSSYNISLCSEKKIVIFHGVVRPTEKGTPFIKDAMCRLQEEMPDKVECISCGGLPYDEYVKLFDRVDILVDQTYGNGWGMNAMIGAMKGKCVLTPCGPENSIYMEIPNIPFVRIEPNSNQIYETLKGLVLDPKRIDAIKIASRKFAEDYCASSIIANKYLDIVGLK